MIRKQKQVTFKQHHDDGADHTTYEVIRLMNVNPNYYDIGQSMSGNEFERLVLNSPEFNDGDGDDDLDFIIE